MGDRHEGMDTRDLAQMLVEGSAPASARRAHATTQHRPRNAFAPRSGAAAHESSTANRTAQALAAATRRICGRPACGWYAHSSRRLHEALANPVSELSRN